MKTYSITETFVGRLAKPRKEEKARFFFDRKITGFGVKVYYSGAKVFGVRIVIKGNEARWLRIGPYGDPWDADSAREEARLIKLNVENSLDPFAHRAPKRTSLWQFKDLAADFFEHFQGMVDQGIRSQATCNEYQRQWKKNVTQKLKLKAVVSLKRADFVKLHKDITKRNPGMKLPVEANRTLAMLGSMFAWTLSRDVEDRKGLKENLTDGVKRNLETERGVWMEDEEQARLLAFLLDPMNRMEVWWPAELEARRRAKFSRPRRLPVKRPHYVTDGAILDALLLCFLTGLRHSEVLSMRWDKISKRSRIIKVPILKKGAEPGAKTEYKEVYITQEIEELLQRIPETSEWVFPSKGRSIKSKSGHLENIQDAWERIRTHLALPQIRKHDFRHTVASELGDIGELTARELKDSMGWKTMQTAMRYLHSRERSRQEKVQKHNTARMNRLTKLNTGSEG